MALFGNFWKRWRSSRVEKKHARRLCMESLENRNLLAAVLTIGKTDNFTDMGKPVPAGEQNLLYVVTVKNTGDTDATNITLVDTQPAFTGTGVFSVANAPAGTNASASGSNGPGTNAVGLIDV